MVKGDAENWKAPGDVLEALGAIWGDCGQTPTLYFLEFNSIYKLGFRCFGDFVFNVRRFHFFCFFVFF